MMKRTLNPYCIVKRPLSLIVAQITFPKATFGPVDKTLVGKLQRRHNREQSLAARRQRLVTSETFC